MKNSLILRLLWPNQKLPHVLVAGGIVCGAVEAQTFTPLGRLPGGTYSDAVGISGDGSTLVGRANTNTPSGIRERAYRWTEAGGLEDLGLLPGSPSSGFSQARAVSDDGSVIVGLAGDPSWHAFRYTDAGGMVALEISPFTSLEHNWSANEVSADGTYTVGSYKEGPNVESIKALRWTDGTAAPERIIAGFSVARAISGDGSIVAGIDGNTRRAFRWTSIGPALSLLPVFPGATDNLQDANGVSGDGTTIVGWSRSSSGQVQAARWIGTNTPESLGQVPGGTSSAAYGVSGDGSVSVGNVNVSGSSRAFVWDAANGMRDLNTVLTDAGVDLSGYTLEIAWDVSADGTKIAARAKNLSDGQIEAGLIDLSPDPGDTTPPVITIAGDNPLDHECGTPYTDPGATAVDDVDGAVAVTSSGSVDVDVLGSYSIDYEAMDAAGNVANESRTVNVVDTTGPDITCPDDIEVDAGSQDGAVVNYSTPTATDLCDPGPVVDCTPPSGSLFPIGDTVVTCTATDAEGNESSCQFTVTVRSGGEMLDLLIGTVEDLPTQPGVKNGLLVKLLNAASKLEDGETQPGINMIEAFKLMVEAQRGKKLTDAEADDLLAQACAIIEVLGGGGPPVGPPAPAASGSLLVSRLESNSGGTLADPGDGLRIERYHTSGTDASATSVLFLMWNGTGVLEMTDRLGGEWTDGGIQNSPFFFETLEPEQFFRLRREE